MATINRKSEALCDLNAFANFCKSKLTAAAQLAQVDAMLEKANGLSEDFYVAAMASESYRAEVPAMKGRAVAQAVVAAK